MVKDKNISLLLRVGLAIVFIYAAIASLLEPSNWVGYIPNFVEFIVSKNVFLLIFSIYEIILGIALLSNYRTFLFSVLSNITILFIVLGNIFVFDIVFRDVAILFMSFALSVLSYKN